MNSPLRNFRLRLQVALPQGFRNVYHKRVKGRKDPPYTIYRKVSGEPVKDLGGTSSPSLTRYEFEVTCWAYSSDELEQMTEAIKLMAGPQTSGSGLKWVWAGPESDGDFQPTENNERVPHSAEANFTVWM